MTERPEGATGRWFTAIPMQYQEGEAFWDRDAGLFCLGFRANGSDSRFVALGSPTVREDRPLILCTLSQMTDARWWKQWQLEGVTLYSWALPRYTGIIRAIHEAGTQVVLILDADGGRSPRGQFLRQLRVKYVYAKMERRWFPRTMALLKTLAGFPRWRYAGTMRHLEFANWIAVQSPLAKQRFSRFLLDCGYGHLLERLVLVHHPVQGHMVYEAAVPKEQLILAVGGWDRLVKGAALLVEVLGLVLLRNPTYRARIIGSGQDSVRGMVARLPASIQNRLEVIGPVPNKLLPRHYQASQIIVNTSYSESFGIAAAEALCCGCSVVGSAQMSAFNYFCSEASGTLACERSAEFYCDSILAEIEAWAQGQRDPVRISRTWTERLHVENVSRDVLSLGQKPRSSPSRHLEYR